MKLQRNRAKRNPYVELNKNVESVLSYDFNAKVAIDAWIKKEFPVKHLSDRLTFSQIGKNYYISMRNLALWSGASKQSLYQYFSSYSSFFSSLGTIVVTESLEGSHRLQVAQSLGLDKYVHLTQGITCFSPRSVALILLVSKTSRGQSFRSFIDDWSPKDSYSMSKLFVTLTSGTNAVAKIF